MIINNKKINNRLLNLEKQFLETYAHLDHETKKKKMFYRAIVNNYNTDNSSYDDMFYLYKDEKFFTYEETIKHLYSEYGAKDFIIYTDRNIRNPNTEINNIDEWEKVLTKTLDYFEIKLNINENILKIEKEIPNMYNIIIMNFINNYGVQEGVDYYNIYAETNNMSTLEIFANKHLGIVKDQNDHVDTLFNYYTSPSNNISKKIVLDIIDDFYKDESVRKYHGLTSNVKTCISKTIKTLKENLEKLDNSNTLGKIDDLALYKPHAIDFILEETLREMGYSERIDIYNKIIIKNGLNVKEKKDINDDINLLFSSKNIINHIINTETNMNVQLSLIKRVDVVYYDYNLEIKKIKANNLKNGTDTNKPKLK